MKKLFLAAMSCLLVTSSAYAFESTISGNYYVRGQSYSYDGNNNDNTASYYDQNFSAAIKINTDENTYIALDVEVRDEESMNGAGAANSDAAFHADYVYISHTFGTGTTVQAGDLDAPRAWGTTFGAYTTDNLAQGEDNGFGLLVSQDIGMGSIVLLTEKFTETATTVSGVRSASDNTPNNIDGDTYLLGAKLNFGDVKFDPAVTFTQLTNTDIWGLDLSASATFGALAVEGEFIYQDYSRDGLEDFDLFGVYAKGSYDFGFMTAGALAAYASSDDMGTTATGDDMSFVMGGDDDFAVLTLFGTELVGTHPSDGSTILAIFASAPISDELTVNGTLGYVMANDEARDNDDFSGIELDLGASYKITDALVYSVKTAYLSADADTAANEMDVFYVENKLSLSF